MHYSSGLDCLSKTLDNHIEISLVAGTRVKAGAILGRSPLAAALCMYKNMQEVSSTPSYVECGSRGAMNDRLNSTWNQETSSLFFWTACIIELPTEPRGDKIKPDSSEIK